MSVNVFRFGLTDGKRYSSVYRPWTVGGGKSDFYLAMRNISNDHKISFHETGDCHTSLMLAETHGSRWQMPKPFAPGLTSVFKILIPESQLTIFPPSDSVTKRVEWMSTPGKDRLAEISLMVSEQDSVLTSWPGAESNSELLKSIPLPHNKTLWLIRVDRDESDGDREMMQVVRSQAWPERGMSGEPMPPLERQRGFAFGFTEIGERVLLELNIME